MTTRRKTGTRRTQKAAPAKRSAVAGAPGRATTRAERGARAALACDCTISQSALLKTQLAAVLNRPGAVTIDLSAVRRIDTAGFQVLTAFIRERQSAGRIVQCAGASESFSVTASLLGLGALFSSPEHQKLLAPSAGNA
jgi:ABC-type transporter Mla MlaB component